MIKLLLERTYLPNQTLGKMRIFKDDEIVGVLSTLELPWKDNHKQISCIPAGTYKVERYSSPKFPNTFQVLNVPNRSAILLHVGNYNTDTLGCILVGFRHVDINNDDLLDVAESRKAMNFLRIVTKNETQIELQIL
jgi:hypothetical protein